MRPVKILPVADLAIALTACASGAASSGSTPDHVRPVAQPADVKGEFTSTLGCTKVTEQDTEEIYVQHLYACSSASGVLSVYTFANATARDAYRQAAETFGSVVVQSGGTWLAVEA
jgi:hypothetical protein